MHKWLKYGLPLLIVLAVQPPAPALGEALTQRDVLPTEFIDGRIFVTPTVQSGQKIRFYTDTGGGWNMVPRELADHLQLEPGPAVRGDGDGQYQTVHWPAFADGQGIPMPLADTWTDGRLVSATADERQGGKSDEGFLGSRWFGARVWEFDYPGETLALLQGGMPPEAMAATPMTTAAQRGMHFPRIEIEVDGQVIPVLFDTGAMVTLGADAARLQGKSEGAVVAGSFITATGFERWREKRPDWRVAEKGDRLADSDFPMIEVPDVRIAGVSTGPAWFALRPDHNFIEFMSSMTDAPVEGAIGGSAFSNLRLIADYPGQRLYVSGID